MSSLSSPLMNQFSLLGLTVSTRSSDGSSKSSTASSRSSSTSDSEGPAAYHTNLANLLPSLRLPPPLQGTSRMRAIAQRQYVGSLDVLGILAKVVMRSHPVINLGPIDHTASCVIVDLDLPDQPLIWASESFCQMSGYALEDIRGRNPRFMQAPGGCVLSRPPTHPRPGPSTLTTAAGRPGSDETITNATPTASQTDLSMLSEPPAYIPPPDSHVPAGSERKHTSQTTVAYIKESLGTHREIQTTILNYRRDGTPFWNWLSIVPVRESGEGSRFRFQVGIMVDLVQQPRAIIQNMQAGFYIRSQS